jgi:ribosomal protein S18 acetylase RimI-like enzyme
MSRLQNPEISENSISELEELTLRRATRDDRFEVGDLYKRSWQELVVRLQLEEIPTDIRELMLSIEASWVVTRGDKIVGFVLLNNELVSKLYVAPEEQKNGVGAILLRQAMASGGRLLYVDEINYVARRFYERHGWRPSGNTDVGLIFPVTILEYEYIPGLVE